MPQLTQSESIKEILHNYSDHLQKKVRTQIGAAVSIIDLTDKHMELLETESLVSEKFTSKQRKLLRRYYAIRKVYDSIKNKPSLEKDDFSAIEAAVDVCKKNEPVWSERPFLQKLTDILSLGFKPLHRRFFSKEKAFKGKLVFSLDQGKSSQELTRIDSNKNPSASSQQSKERLSLDSQSFTSSKPNDECFVQVPSQNHLIHTQKMIAGNIDTEDQYQRLSHMVESVEKVQEIYPSLPVIKTDQALFSQEWMSLFEAINKADENKAIQSFQQIPSTDPLLKSILGVHSSEYLQRLIRGSVCAVNKGIFKLTGDTLITSKTFEILLYDIVTTINNSAKLCFSIGLPTHHAYSNAGSGFCVLNKSAIIMKHAELTHPQPLKYVIVGLDVNRDNGLCSILMNSASHMDICHVDVFDSRVYPWNDYEAIRTEYNIKKDPAIKEIIGKYNSCCLQKDHFQYHAVDLSIIRRERSKVHPAILFSLSHLEETINSAKKTGQKTFIVLPTGWDSHKDETAPCGTRLNKQTWMTASEANETRFNDEDFDYFYEKVFTLYTQNKEHIAGLYWGLEGGYERSMYEKQVELLLNKVATEVLHVDPKPNPSLTR